MTFAELGNRRLIDAMTDEQRANLAEFAESPPPFNLEGPPPSDDERAENYRYIHSLHPGNRFRLMFGQPLLEESLKVIRRTKD